RNLHHSQPISTKHSQPTTTIIPAAINGHLHSSGHLSGAGAGNTMVTGDAQPAGILLGAPLEFIAKSKALGPRPFPSTSSDNLAGAELLSTRNAVSEVLYVREDGVTTMAPNSVSMAQPNGPPPKVMTPPSGNPTNTPAAAGTLLATPNRPLSFWKAITGRRDGGSGVPYPTAKEFTLDGEYEHACGSIIRSEGNKVK
ncbi:Unknown protein, partial [Striga hermonthica]